MIPTTFQPVETFHQIDARQLQASWDAEAERGTIRHMIARVRAIHAQRPAGEPPLLIGAGLVLMVLFVLPALVLAAIGGVA